MNNELLQELFIGIINNFQEALIVVIPILIHILIDFQVFNSHAII